MEEETGDDLAMIMERLVSDLREMKAQINAMRRYLRDEGFGEDDDEEVDDEGHGWLMRGFREGKERRKQRQQG